MRDVNVVVVGGGPAGATVAILCRLFGLDVAIIEASHKRVSPGECVPEFIDQYFRALGVDRQLITPERVRYRGLDFHWGDREVHWPEAGEEGVNLGFRQDGIQMPRDLLDKTLLQRAREVGVHVYEPCVAKGLIARKEGRIAGVATNQGVIRADFVVDAAGSRHWIARKLRLALQYFSPELHGYFGWAEGRCPEREHRPRVISDDTGWLFTSRIADNLYQFSRMSFTPLDLPGDWLPEEFHGMRPVVPYLGGERPAGRLRGADLSWRRVFQPVGNGFFLCGDAVARTDPVGQQGVYKSIVAGFLCAQALNDIYYAGVSEEEARTAYADRINNAYLRDLTQLRDTYQRHPHAPEWLRDPSSIQVRYLE